MSTTMDQIHHIREMYFQQDKNISEIASETGLNRKTISKYVDMEDFNCPPPTPASVETHESKLDPFRHLIDEWLQADKLAPRNNAIQLKEYLNVSKEKPKVSIVAIGLLLYTLRRRKRNSVSRKKRATSRLVTIREKLRLILVLQISTKMANFIMKPNIWFSVSHIAMAAFCS